MAQVLEQVRVCKSKNLLCDCGWLWGSGKPHLCHCGCGGILEQSAYPSTQTKYLYTHHLSGPKRPEDAKGSRYCENRNCGKLLVKKPKETYEFFTIRKTCDEVCKKDYAAYVPDRYCKVCPKLLVRKEGETTNGFRTRKCCNDICANLARHSEEVRKKQSESNKRFYQENLEARKRQGDRLKKIYEDNPNLRKQQGEATSKRYKENPELRKLQSESLKKYLNVNDDVLKERIRLLGDYRAVIQLQARRRRLQENITYVMRNWFSLGSLDRRQSPETIAKRVAKNRGKKRSPEQIAAMKKAQREYAKNHPKPPMPLTLRRIQSDKLKAFYRIHPERKQIGERNHRTGEPGRLSMLKHRKKIMAGMRKKSRLERVMEKALIIAVKDLEKLEDQWLYYFKLNGNNRWGQTDFFLHYGVGIAIECDGEYVHGITEQDYLYPNGMIKINGNSYVRREKWEEDGQKTVSIVKQGHHIIRLSGYVIKNHMDKCLEIIKEAMKTRKPRMWFFRKTCCWSYSP